MAMYSNFHHSNHPNIRQPYGSRPARRTDSTGGGMGGGGRSYGSYGDRNDRGGSSGATLWMGNIDQTLDENAIQYAFNSVGITVANVKIIRDKENGLPLGYAFVTFDDRSTAQECLRELNGKKIPNTEDDKRFFLKRANRSNNMLGGTNGGSGGGSSGGGGGRGNDRFSVFVGNLPPEIDNDILLSAFASYYPSTSSARVIMNEGISKGFGFVSFEDEYDYFNALNQPNMMLGSAPISVSRARNSQGGSRGGGSGGSGGRGFSSSDSRDGGDRRQTRRPTNYSNY